MAITLAQTAAGTKLGVSVTLPASDTALSYAGLTYTDVGEITDLGNFGKDFTLITHNPLGNRATFKFKGSYNNGQLPLKLARALTDGGQALLSAQADLDTDIAVRIDMPGSEMIYLRGKVMSFVTNIGSVNNIIGADVKFEISGDIFYVP